jgi:hypothetical protein
MIPKDTNTVTFVQCTSDYSMGNHFTMHCGSKHGVHGLETKAKLSMSFCKLCRNLGWLDETCGFYYKHITIVNDGSRVVSVVHHNLELRL